MSDRAQRIARITRDAKKSKKRGVSKHTPGPWEVQRYLVNERDEEVSSMARGNLKVRLRVVADDSPMMVVADMVAGSPSDAALIAAAPDLLAALLLAEKFIEDDTCRHDAEKAAVLRSIAAAIAKAEGKS